MKSKTITAAQRTAIEEELRSGDPQEFIAFRHGVSVETVREIGRAAGIARNTKRFARRRGWKRLTREDVWGS